METLRVKVEKVSIDLAVVGEAQAALVERSAREKRRVVDHHVRVKACV